MFMFKFCVFLRICGAEVEGFLKQSQEIHNSKKVPKVISMTYLINIC